jgi:hypothetical protein
MSSLSLRRGAAAALVLALLALATPSVAQPLSATAKTISTAQAAVGACGSLASAVVGYTVVAGNVTKVALTALSAGCNGASVWVTLVNSANTDVGRGGPVTVASGGATFSSLSANPAAASVINVHLAAVGP